MTMHVGGVGVGLVSKCIGSRLVHAMTAVGFRGMPCCVFGHIHTAGCQNGLCR